MIMYGHTVMCVLVSPCTYVYMRARAVWVRVQSLLYIASHLFCINRAKANTVQYSRS